MKFKTILLSIMALATFSACVMDYYGGGPMEIELTENNYLYEGDLYDIYLNTEIANVETRLLELEDILNSNQATENDKKEYEEKQALLDDLFSELNNILDLDQVLLGVPRPRPPCPEPKNCDYSLFEYVVVSSTVKEVSIKILNADNEQVGGGQIDDLMILDDTQGLLAVSNLSISHYEGPIKIEVALIDETGQDRTYLVE
jgi:hypothetical protein